MARSIGESVERLRRSIDDLMALLKLEHAIAAEAREPTAMGAFLETLADEYRRDPRASGWTFIVDVTPEAAAAAPVINRRRWQEMLRNLVDNALVQPATDRRIVLGARLDKRWLVTVGARRGAPASRPRTRARSSAASSRSGRRACRPGRDWACRSSRASRAPTARGSRSNRSPARARRFGVTLPL